MRRIGLLLAVLFLTANHGFGQAPRRIKAVKTWKELQNVPPIRLGDGVSIRLGIERLRIPQWTGALVYCLTEGYTPVLSGTGESFGPVLLSIQNDDVKSLTKKSKWGGGKRDWPKGSFLYVRALPINRVGTYTVTVMDQRRKIIAVQKVVSAKGAVHPWNPWFFLRGIPNVAKNPPIKGIALPSVNRYSPIAFIKKGKQKIGRLPTLMPSAATPKMSIKLDGNDVVVRSSQALNASHSEFYFLARWWINGKPYFPKQTDRFWASVRRGGLHYEKQLSLPLLFEPRFIGAKPGDTIGLQLLYSRTEWDWCGSDLHGSGGRRKLPESNLRISNRIEFIAPRNKGRSSSQ